MYETEKWVKKIQKGKKQSHSHQDERRGRGSRDALADHGETLVKHVSLQPTERSMAEQRATLPPMLEQEDMP